MGTPINIIQALARLLLAALLLAGVCGAAPAKEQKTVRGRVIRVSDGDTIWVADAAGAKHKIRMLGIDAPESSQRFGKRSAERLDQMVDGLEVSVVYSESDQYGRLLGTVWCGGRNVNLAMVREGLAWAYRHNRDPQYEEAQREARAKKLGLWADAKAVDPWEFRRQRWDPAGNAPQDARAAAAADGARSRPGAPRGAPAAPVGASALPPMADRREYHAGKALPVGSRTPAPVCGDWPDTDYWLSTNSGKRHNRRCENYRKTRGYPCLKGEGAPCGKCGG